MNCDIEKLKQDIESLEKKCKSNIVPNDVRGTILLVKTNFDPNTTLSVENIKIASDLVKVEELSNNKEDCFVVNCFDAIDSYDFTNDFVFSKTEVKPGDTVYAVTAHDGDLYGLFVLGIFTEKPDDQEIIKKYNEHINSLNDEPDWPYEFYLSNIFEIIVQ